MADADDSHPQNPNACRDTDSDTCDDCTNTGADESGGDPANDGDDTDSDGRCDAVECETPWASAVDFESGGGYLQPEQNNNSLNLPLRRSSNTHQPWGVATVAHTTNIGLGQAAIWAQDDGDKEIVLFWERGIMGDRVLKLRFQNDDGNRFEQTAFCDGAPVGWYGIYVGYNGGFTNTLENAQETIVFKQVDLATGAVSDIACDTTFTGDGFSAPMDGGFYVGAKAGGDWPLEARVASTTVTTYLRDQTPEDNEIRHMVLDPVSWMNTYKVGQEYRAPEHSGLSTQSPFTLNNYQSRRATQVWVMAGEGSSNDTVYNQVALNDSSETALRKSGVVGFEDISSELTVDCGIIASNDGPVIWGATAATVNEDGSVSGDLEAADDDGVASGSWEILVPPTHGEATLNAITGEWTYTPDEHYNGADAFTVAVTDDSDQGNVGTLDVEITVTPIDDPATFSGDLSVNGVALTTVTGTLVATDDADGMSNPNYTVTGPGTCGTADIDSNTGVWTFDATDACNDTFTVTVTDDDGNEANQVISVWVTNYLPYLDLDTNNPDYDNEVSYTVGGSPAPLATYLGDNVPQPSSTMNTPWDHAFDFSTASSSGYSQSAQLLRML